MKTLEEVVKYMYTEMVAADNEAFEMMGKVVFGKATPEEDKLFTHLSERAMTFEDTLLSMINRDKMTELLESGMKKPDVHTYTDCFLFTKEADITDSPSNTLGNMTILLDGETREEGGGIAVEFERGITLTPIDKESVYVFLDINKPRNDGSFNSVGVMQKSYIIDSEELVEFISKNT